MKEKDFTPTYQRNFPNVPYPSAALPNATIKSGGCGACCGLMIVENLTAARWKMADWAKWVRGTGARVNGGTNMAVLGKAIAKKYDLDFRTNNSEAELAACLKAGGLAVANNCRAYGSWRGLFSTGGHFVVVLGLSGGKYIVSDPDWYDGKYNGSSSLSKWRAARLTRSGKYLLVDAANLHKATVNASPNYYLFMPSDKPTVRTKDEIGITIDGKTQDWFGVLDGSTTMVPLRTIAEALGCTVTWDGKTNTANIKRG